MRSQPGVDGACDERDASAMTSRFRRRAGERLKRWGNRLVDRCAVILLKAARKISPQRLASGAAALTRMLGPFLSEHRIGRENLAAAFPEKSAAEIDKILAGVWDNLGRVVAEFVHLDRIPISGPGEPGALRITHNEDSLLQAQRIQQNPGPRLFFAAHLANWELPAIIARRFNFAASILYRPPNLPAVREAVLEIRSDCMGTLVASGFDAPLRLAGALDRGDKVGMLLDQHESRGVEVSFFGRRCQTTPLLAQLARHFDCPIHGLRVVRLANNDGFWVEITDAIEPVRDAAGLIDVQGTTQVMTSVIESWVREHPEQWLWLHRRWR
jgi:KDO2-lipid IV(A) lauroyltransferase